ncbi:MAG: sulfur reduction protein DsrE, partial [Desulfovibrionaceae bacterium]|nr:sulfur reduction protein DsrE [Desulfovibrionaceae bacterium]
MTNNIVITASCGTDNPNRSTRAIHLATVAHKEGKNVTLFLLDD